MKQTAVEWLLEQWPILKAQLPPQLIEQAKEMEKEQMMNFCSIYANLILQGHPITPSEFYNETFCRQFIADNKTSSATKCICGKEKFEHI